jgi:Flp pilus assembly protein TadG
MAGLHLRLHRENGVALVYMAVTLSGLLLMSGLALDTGRAYVVKAQLSKAVDGAALGAARSLNSGDPRGEAARIFHANFPSGYLGTSTASDPTAAANFYTLTTDAATGVNTVAVTASVSVPTTFMRVGNITELTVGSSGEATRRMVDLSLVLDVSSSIGSKWSTVRDAARNFIGSFDQAHDRLALVTFSNGAQVLDAMPSTRGFDKTRLESDVPSTLPGGSTNMVEGVYRGWDELRAVPSGSQSGLRVIVLFTDGASNGVPGDFDGSGAAKTLRTWDFPKNATDPDSQTWDAPHIDGLYDTATGSASPSYSCTDTTPLPGRCLAWNSTVTIPQVPYLPAGTWHTHHRSSGIPTSFPLQVSTLKVNGSAQNAVRGLRHFNAGAGKYPAEVFNINNAARNVLEIIANAARNDNGDYKIRIYTIGMGYLLRDHLGTIPEMPEDILKRISNDATSPDFSSAQLEGKYFYAPTVDDVAPAFEGIQNQILRLSK